MTLNQSGKAVLVFVGNLIVPRRDRWKSPSTAPVRASSPNRL